MVVIRLALEATTEYIVTQYQPLGRSETDARYRSHEFHREQLASHNFNLELFSKGTPE